MKLSKIVTALALLALPTFGTPVIESAVINTYLNQLTITGTDFDPSGIAPVVTLKNEALTLVSSSNPQVVANLPATIPAGTYLLRLTNSAGQAITFPVTMPSPNAGQFYTASQIMNEIDSLGSQSQTFPIAGFNPANLPTGTYGSTLSECGAPPFGIGATCTNGATIIPADCNVDLMVAQIASPSYLTGLFIVLNDNEIQTAMLPCQINIFTPVTCPLPASPISVSAGDVLTYTASYVTAGYISGPLNLTLRCR